MFQDADLIAAFENESTLSVEPLILAEFNLNELGNIAKIGVYKNRSDFALVNTYDADDVADAYTDADVSYFEYNSTDDDPFRVVDATKQLMFPLGDVFLPFRPRSGINKARYIPGRYIDNVRSGSRPRYYMPDRSDFFKYWSSYKHDGTIDRGISGPAPSGGVYAITDAVPFIVYTEPVHANRVVVKMQTNIGDIDLGTARAPDGTSLSDPLYSYSRATVPDSWSIQRLTDSNVWETLISFTSATPVPRDGYVEIFYGITIPEAFASTFTFRGYTDASLLPTDALIGDAYITDYNSTSAGSLRVWNGAAWVVSNTAYSWQLLNTGVPRLRGVATQVVNPPSYDLNGETVYKEFQNLHGLRIVVDTMHSANAAFDLIELSPRLSVNLSQYVESYTANKMLAGDDQGLPVSSLAVSNGQVSLSNSDNIFTESNSFNGTTGSLLASYGRTASKFQFYEIIKDINGADKYVPIKTYYADKFPSPSGGLDSVTVSLRDLFFRLETTNAPSVFSQDTTLTYAVATVLDYIGFSNYKFLNIDVSNDPVIPHFFSEPNVSVAEILQRLAIATQSAMFFDEDNNFVVMLKDYLMPEVGSRSTDLILSGNDSPLANIESIQPNETVVINDGQIDYTTRYVQREIASLGSSVLQDNERVYRYRPVLLWEVAASQELKTINEGSKTGEGFALGACALNTDLSSAVPTVVSNQVIDNIIDIGESIYWLPRFKGYLYANGEIIRFDAVEYAIPGQGVVWIQDNQEYQNYFGSLPFNGKIYPTGRVRIFSEPYYEIVGVDTVIKNGAVRIHGRGQFATDITSHNAGLSSYWSDNANTYGTKMYGDLIFNTIDTADIVQATVGTTTRVDPASYKAAAVKSSRNGIIKNFMSSKVYEDGYTNGLRTTAAGSVQASALVLRGKYSSTSDPVVDRDFISYVYKDLSAQYPYRHFGTRMRIIGKVDQNGASVANGSSNYFSLQAQNAADKTSINGGSGGIGIFTDPSNSSGYYFEIIALNDKNIEKYSPTATTQTTDPVIHNIVFYKIKPQAKSGDTASGPAVPQKLWGGLTGIQADQGIFVGQDRLGSTSSNSVYDLSIEYEIISGGAIRFYLYINNILIKIVDDSSPLSIRTTACLFTRSGSECMFENFYALEDLVARNGNTTIVGDAGIFGNGITTNDSMRKYAISGAVQSAFLTGISSSNNATSKIYFEEFGTIMREAVHFDIKYDQAFPAFYSRIAKTFTSDRSYTISGYYGGAYEAEFIVFNSADKAITLDDSTGSYLRILGVTFTQNTTHTLSLDNYFGRISDSSNPIYEQNQLVSPVSSLESYNKVKASRAKYGRNQFSLNALYIQSDTQARDIMKWLIERVMRPRKTAIINTFAMPHLQVGDIVTVAYTMPDGVEWVDADTQFLVKEINYNRASDQITQAVRVVEV